MKMRMIKWSIVVSLLIFTGSVFAQPPGPPEFKNGPMRERIRERIETMKIWKLTDALNLTSEQSEKFFVLYNKHQKAFEEIEDKRMELINRLDSLINNPQSSNQKMNELISQFQDVPQQMAVENERFLKDISPILSVRQQAELIVFEERFRQQMREFVREIRLEYRDEKMDDKP
jgi:Spy/CpxP family protein refolding chaperone